MYRLRINVLIQLSNTGNVLYMWERYLEQRIKHFKIFKGKYQKKNL